MTPGCGLQRKDMTDLANAGVRAMLQGACARLCGRGVQACPYPADGPLALCWHYGWATRDRRYASPTGSASKGRDWTEQELVTLALCAGSVPTALLADMLGRSPGAVRTMLARQRQLSRAPP